MTLKKAFKDTFSHRLEELGFKYNSKEGIFFRVINNELVQYITYVTTPSLIKGYKAYKMFFGIFSIYTYSLTKEKLLQWGIDMYGYAKQHSLIIKNSDMAFLYNEESIVDVTNQSLEKTNEVIIPVLNKVTNLDNYIEYRKNTMPGALFGAADYDVHENDALVLIKVENHDDFTALFQKLLDERMKMVEAKTMGGTYEYHYNMLHRSIIEGIAESRDKVYNDPELYARAMKEIERRKEANLKYLHEIGVI